jgi:methyl-accepting chemotaxis protein
MVEASVKACETNMENYLKAAATSKAETTLRAQLKKEHDEYLKTFMQARLLARKAVTPAGIAELLAYRDSTFAPSFARLRDTITKLNALLDKDAAAVIDKAERESSLISRAIVGVIFIAAIILFLFGIMLTRNITNVLSEVSLVAESMAVNDLTHKVSETALARKDEFGDMANALNKMAHTFVQVVKNVTSIAENIAASSEQLNANADQTAKASTDVADASTKMLESTDSANKELGKAADLVSNALTSLNNISSIADNIADTAHKTADSSTEGNESVAKAVTSINTVGESTAKISGAVTELKESSDKISAIVEMITSIANQTNLLALNAAIEAARAGEHGRGFAVVAEEVRKLAEESGKAAQEIDTLIAQNTQNIQHTVTLMDEQKNLVSQGVEKVNTAGESFAQIATLVNSLAQEIGTVQSAAKEAADGGESTMAATKVAQEATGVILSEVTNVSAAAEEQAASTEEIASSSQVLAQMAQDLSNLSAQFKV